LQSPNGNSNLAMTIYLDNSATTQVRQEVIDAMLPYLSQHWGNPSSVHTLGKNAKAAVDAAREQVALLLNCKSEEISFTACGTNSNNVALLGRARFLAANNAGKHLITSQIEHPSVFGPAKYLESQGWSVTYLPVNREGFVDSKQLQSAITPQTSMISIVWANNEIGTVQRIEELAKLAQDREIYFHTDAVQVPGKLAMDLAKVPISALSLSAHKFYAPKGVGVSFLRSGTNVMPIEFGGGQEKGLFPGTESVANIVAVGKAAELARIELSAAQEKLIVMQTHLWKELAKLPQIKFTGALDLKHRLPGHVSFIVEGAQGESLVLRCDLQGLCVSSGSACHQGIIEPSHVLKAIGLGGPEGLGSLRVSFGKGNTMEECKIATHKLTDIVLSMTKQPGARSEVAPA
jgi:cysteine desulfurase